MKQSHTFGIFLYVLLAAGGLQNAAGQTSRMRDVPLLQNPISVRYLKDRLRKESPRLVLTPVIEQNLRAKIKSDPVVGNMYKAIQLNGNRIMGEPLLQHVVEGRRLLGISRTMLYRMNVLCMLYRIDKDLAVLKRIDQELQAVCSFADWNPSHFLDVAEMSMAVALAVDWTGADLPASTVEMAKRALINKGLRPSFHGSRNSTWVARNNNWNQVCHGGMVAAAIATAEENPRLAARTIKRALAFMPNALKEYLPDGVYPEGATYWSYGTTYSVLTASMFESAFGTDFGISGYPGFKESADFRLLSVAPSGWYFNFSDCGDKRSPAGDLTLAWFAAQTGNSVYFEKKRFLMDPDQMGDLSRYAGTGLVWLSQMKKTEHKELPLSWKGDGDNPVVFFRGGPSDPHNYYFGGKGGRAYINHGNMDAGSFVFELDGVRWAVDPGNQDYNELEQQGFDLWAMCQTCDRWKLLTKSNLGHSTITINEARHDIDGLAQIVDFKNGDRPEATVEMTHVFGGLVDRWMRRFVKEDDHSLVIEDRFKVNESTNQITWQLMTTAQVERVKGGAVLSQDGKQLRLENLSHPEWELGVVDLDPPPLKLDRHIENLKRIEIHVPARRLLNQDEVILRVRLSGVE